MHYIDLIKLAVSSAKTDTMQNHKKSAFNLLMNGIRKLIPRKKKVINIVFRYDDYSALSNTDLELEIIEIFRKNATAITFSATPFVVSGDWHEISQNELLPLSEEKGKIIKSGHSEGLIDIALHGYSHQTCSADQYTEFQGVDYYAQLEKISKGKSFLEGIIHAPITTFVPPWNTYDLNTLYALEALGFTAISADREGAAKRDIRLKFLPCTCSLKRLKSSAVQAARAASDIQPIIVVLFHDFEFLDIDKNRGMITLQEFADLVGWLSSQDDIRILSISQAVRSIKDLSARRFLNIGSKRSALYQKLAP